MGKKFHWYFTLKIASSVSLLEPVDYIFSQGTNNLCVAKERQNKTAKQDWLERMIYIWCSSYILQ